MKKQQKLCDPMQIALDRIRKGVWLTESFFDPFLKSVAIVRARRSFLCQRHIFPSDIPEFFEFYEAGQKEKKMAGLIIGGSVVLRNGLSQWDKRKPLLIFTENKEIITILAVEGVISQDD